MRATIKEGARQRNSTLHWVADPKVQVSAPTAPGLRRRAADECDSAPIGGALSATELERLTDGALDWLPSGLPSRQTVYAAA